MIRRQRRKRKLNAEINVVPYIDVMMVLLVIFMVTAPMLTQGVDVELPKASADPVDSKDSEPMIVTVDATGQYYINVGGSEQTAISAEDVGERVQKVLAANPEKMLLVKGDKRAEYDKVVGLMVLLQHAGAPSVGLVTE
jgi:biopolymer transport protein TolR